MIALALPMDEIASFCRKYRIERLAVFGSAIKGAVRENSDVDFLVTFDPQATVGFIGMAHMENELSELIGRKADLRTPMELSRFFRQAVQDTAETIYEK